MNNIQSKLLIREKRIKRANQIKELHASGVAINQIAKKLRISAPTVRNDLKRDVTRPISRNTWKDARVMMPTKEGVYWIGKKALIGKHLHSIVDLEKALVAIKLGSFDYWCGPINLPKYDPAEIEMERKLREVTK